MKYCILTWNCNGQTSVRFSSLRRRTQHICSTQPEMIHSWAIANWTISPTHNYCNCTWDETYTYTYIFVWFWHWLVRVISRPFAFQISPTRDFQLSMHADETEINHAFLIYIKWDDKTTLWKGLQKLNVRVEWFWRGTRGARSGWRGRRGGGQPQLC